MIDSDLFSRRNMGQLKIKAKLVVFYDLKEDKDLLNEIRNKYNTCMCQYCVIPIHIEGNLINETSIKKYIRNHITGYKKDLDIVCIIKTNILQLSEYNIFKSIDSFQMWLQNL
ncbi:hypothetical protein [Sporomusa aerivorans]|uniref:hypothetical protein n=1 Tax=Sporomusa aerivorans TaxID=204936 RepID=UPI00352AF02A